MSAKRNTRRAVVIGCFMVLQVALGATGCRSDAKVDADAGPTERPQVILLRQAAHEGPEATSLLGLPLMPPELPSDVRTKREAELEGALADYDRNPSGEDEIIWVGRRLAYLGRFNEAINVLSHGLSVHPNSYKLLRHRGHRYVTLRRFELAEADLRKAVRLIRDVPDEVEIDGQPNAQNIPTGTTHTNVYYHLGLALYMQGDYATAESAFRRCHDRSQNDDMRVAAAYWLYLSQRRQLKNADAALVLDGIQPAPQMTVIENTGYHQLLLVFKERLTPEQVATSSGEKASVDLATVGYGLAMRDLLDGDESAARDRFEQIIASTNWAAFGHIGSEVELARAQRVALAP